jgi:hypothetical protein
MWLFSFLHIVDFIQQLIPRWAGLFDNSLCRVHSISNTFIWPNKESQVLALSLFLGSGWEDFSLKGEMQDGQGLLFIKEKLLNNHMSLNKCVLGELHDSHHDWTLKGKLPSFLSEVQVPSSLQESRSFSERQISALETF